MTRFDYILQAWTVNGIVETCGHPATKGRSVCCNARRFAGMRADVARAKLAKQENK